MLNNFNEICFCIALYIAVEEVIFYHCHLARFFMFRQPAVRWGIIKDALKQCNNMKKCSQEMKGNAILDSFLLQVKCGSTHLVGCQSINVCMLYVCDACVSSFADVILYFDNCIVIV